MSVRWEIVEGGFHKEWRYVNESGRIIGGVRGSHYQESDGWYAHVETPGRVNLGRFVIPDLAKKAVEGYKHE